ncbi:hypothetical protein B0H19DRAFT_1077849 [Mycena capillaripes]|nr:hypothetical protein B0H19DRAFT_1077849 [Mycena capillaripes]
MPSQSATTATRLNNITICMSVTTNTIKTLATALKVPFLEAIANTTQSLLKNIQTVKKNKDTCVHLMEQTHDLLDAIIVVHIESEIGGELPLSVLNHVGKFTQILHKIHTFVEAQQNGSKVRSFFRQGEMSTLLKDCKVGLQQARESFQAAITQMQEDAHKRQQEVLNMIESLSEASISDKASSV